MDERKEFVIRISQKEGKGWPCPRCGGTGNMMDGGGSISSTEIRVRLATKCFLCNGKGRVNVSPLDDE